jgi:flagellar basal body-associated protein FliL
MSDVDIGLNFDVGQVVSSGTSALVNVLLWLFLIIVVGGLLVAMFYFFSFKHRVRVKKSVRGRTVVIDDKARVYKDGNGAYWWKFLKTGLKVSPPPSQAIDINKKGKYVCEGYLLEDDRFIWRVDEFDGEKYKDNFDTSFEGKYKFFSGEERSLLAGQVIKAQEHKKKKFLDVLVAIAPYLAIIMIFVLFLVFFDNVVSPAVELGNSIRASHELQLKTMEIIQNIVMNKEAMMLNANNIPN